MKVWNSDNSRMVRVTLLCQDFTSFFVLDDLVKLGMGRTSSVEHGEYQVFSEEVPLEVVLAGSRQGAFDNPRWKGAAVFFPPHAGGEPDLDKVDSMADLKAKVKKLSRRKLPAGLDVHWGVAVDDRILQAA